MENIATRLKLMRDRLKELSEKELDGDSMAVEILKILDADDHVKELLKAS